MSYQALYRKYRPISFKEIIGQDHIVNTLSNQVKANKIVHAYLFCGSRGTGKTSTAKIFAKSINCEDSANGSPCGKCETCIAMDDACNMDIVEIDAASNNRVDEIRDIREKVKFTPIKGKYKIYIIDEVHMLTDSAYNALLKTLEEPPKHIVFILATTEPHKLPATILSRCLRFDFSLISIEILSDHLKNIFKLENIEFDEESIKVIANAGEGSVRDTLSIADSAVAYCNGKLTLDKVLDILGLNDNETLVEATESLFKKDLGKCLEIIDKVYKQGKNMSVFAKNLSVHFRNLLVIKTCKNPNKILNLPNNIFEKFETQANSLNTKELMEAMKIFGNIESELKYALSPKILIETAFVSFILGDNVKKN
ncbi:MAG: DNA polymerase III subunit gamma/tau [Clostridia bacterium]|nr:DNA polymerase III subunit gamma/tau [Clostridia bacterium]MDD4686377.1 DNA polymerase III subunit gamma/tau [Clostridia bacterium]